MLRANPSASAVPVQLHETPLAGRLDVAVNAAPFCVNVIVIGAAIPMVASSVPARHSPPVTAVLVSVIVQSPASWTRCGGGVVLGAAVGVLSSPQAASG